VTTKEIAKVTGNDERTVQRWIVKIIQRQTDDVDRQDDGVNSIRMKAGSKDPHNPADYTLEEACLIIEAGMGPDVAGIFRANVGPVFPAPRARPLTGAYLRELNVAYGKSIISREDWRRMAGLDPAPENAGEKAPAPSLPPPCHDLPDFLRQRREKAALLSGPEAWHPPIPVIQAFIDECCIREGSMTHMDTDRIFFDWQRGRGTRSMIDTRNLFKCLGLMGYATRKKNNVFTVEGLSLRPGNSCEAAV
jgi:hypothetical protein